MFKLNTILRPITLFLNAQAWSLTIFRRFAALQRFCALWKRFYNALTEVQKSEESEKHHERFTVTVSFVGYSYYYVISGA